MGDCIRRALAERLRAIGEWLSPEPSGTASGSGGGNSKENERPLRIELAGVTVDASVVLPSHLSSGEKRELFEQLQEATLGRMVYYTTLNDPEPMQGDGWEQIDWVDPAIGERRKLRAAVLSNSCDITTANRRIFPTNIVFGILVRLSKLILVLREERIAEQTIEDTVRDIRRQRLTYMFYLPDGPGTDNEYVLLFDNIQAQSLARFQENPERRRIFSLSQAGFWLFLVKLSAHFCRAGEAVHRDYIRT